MTEHSGYGMDWRNALPATAGHLADRGPIAARALGATTRRHHRRGETPPLPLVLERGCSILGAVGEVANQLLLLRIDRDYRFASALECLRLRVVHVEPLTETIACLAGEAMAKVKRATAIDAFVMASAALRGDVVYTGDVDDLERLRTFFPTVRVLSL